MNRWDRLFFDLCDRVADMSKDPSTKIGAILVRPNGTVASVGFNGFPRGVLDLKERYDDRPTKYKMTVHAECNAILSANEPVKGYRLYVSPLHPCANCAGMIIQSGISSIFTKVSDRPDWDEHFTIAKQMFDEAGVSVIQFEAGA